MANIRSDQQLNYVLITPAVSIDHSFDNGNIGICVDDNINVTARTAIHGNNNNIYVRADKPPAMLPHRRANAMPKRSWRWCALICSAVRCFGNNSGFSAAAAYTSSTYADHVLALDGQAKAPNLPFEL